MSRSLYAIVALLLGVFVQTPPIFGADVSVAGVGVVVERHRNGNFEIIDLVAGGPAAVAGVLRGEVITAVDNQSTEGLTLEELVSRIRGPEGTLVTLSLKKRSSIRDVRLVRARITLNCYMEGNVQLSVSVSSGSGYIQGYVGRDRLDLNVFGGRATGTFKGDAIGFYFSEDQFGGNRVSLSGWVRGQRVGWTGFNGWINAYQGCIQ